MSELRGVGIGLGVAQGPVARMAEPLPAPEDVASARTPEEELARVREAVAAVARELEDRGSKAGGLAREVLEAQAMMAEDPTLDQEVSTRVNAGKTGEFAVHDAFATFRDMLSAMGGYLGERAADLDDVAQRVIAPTRRSWTSTRSWRSSPPTAAPPRTRPSSPARSRSSPSSAPPPRRTSPTVRPSSWMRRRAS
jgi:phosphotransferase system enzyme I (PtsI)